MERFTRLLALLIYMVFGAVYVNMAHAEDIVNSFIYPVGPEGQLKDYHISQYFGTTYAEGYWSCDAVGENCVRMYGHDGIDISNYGCDSSVYAAADGYVVYAEPTSGWGNQIRIRHLTSDGYRYTLYGHLHNVRVSEGQTVTRGQQIASIGGNLDSDGASSGCHLHFGILTENISGNGYYYDNMPSTHIDPLYFIAYSAIDAKADELWGLNLIESETGDIHWYEDASDPFLIEDWNGGTWGGIAITYDSDTNQTEHAYVLRHGFLDYYLNYGGPDTLGPPLGDELDSTDTSGHAAYDPYCDGEVNGQYGDGVVTSSERGHCLELFCGSSRTYTSVQRFEYATLCWNADTWEAECDPTWDNPVCTNLVYATAQTVEVGDLVEPEGSGTVYWYDGLGLRGIVSADVFNACGFDWGNIQELPQEVLDEVGYSAVVNSPVDCGVLKHGDVFTTPDTTTVYAYHSGLKRPITSGDVFTACGFDWSGILTFPSSSVSNIPEGPVINSSDVCHLNIDLLWRETQTGSLSVWQMDEVTPVTSSSLGSSGTQWSLEGLGDFNGDGQTDLVWRHLTPPYEVYLWLMNGTQVTSSWLLASTSGPDWVIRGVGDFTHDGEPDLLWKQEYTGELSVWVIYAGVLYTSVELAEYSDTAWDIRAVGDLTGDEQTDLLWRHPATGALSLWEMDGTSYVSSLTLTTSSLTSWDVEGVADFTGDGVNDLLWRNWTTGELSVWELSGTTYLSSVSITTSDPQWDLVGVAQLVE